MICLAWFESRFGKTIRQSRLPPEAKGRFHVCGRWLELTPAFLLTLVSRFAACGPSRAGNTGKGRREQASHLLSMRATRRGGRSAI